MLHESPKPVQSAHGIIDEKSYRERYGSLVETPGRSSPPVTYGPNVEIRLRSSFGPSNLDPLRIH